MHCRIICLTTRYIWNLTVNSSSRNSGNSKSLHVSVDENVWFKVHHCRRKSMEFSAATASSLLRPLITLFETNKSCYTFKMYDSYAWSVTWSFYLCQSSYMSMGAETSATCCCNRDIILIKVLWIGIISQSLPVVLPSSCLWSQCAWSYCINKPRASMSEWKRVSSLREIKKNILHIVWSALCLMIQNAFHVHIAYILCPVIYNSSPNRTIPTYSMH